MNIISISILANHHLSLFSQLKLMRPPPHKGNSLSGYQETAKRQKKNLKKKNKVIQIVDLNPTKIMNLHYILEFSDMLNINHLMETNPAVRDSCISTSRKSELQHLVLLELSAQTYGSLMNTLEPRLSALQRDGYTQLTLLGFSFTFLTHGLNLGKTGQNHIAPQKKKLRG